MEMKYTTKVTLDEKEIEQAVKESIEKKTGRYVTHMYIRISERCEGIGMSESYEKYIDYAEATLGEYFKQKD